MNDVTGQEVVLEQDARLEVAQLEERFRQGAKWFNIIALLSLVNTGIILSGGDWNFIIGLGITQLIDVIAQGVILTDPDLTILVRAIEIPLVLGISGLLALFGLLSLKKYQWAYIIGMVLYAADGLLFVLVGDILGLAFHAFVLFNLFGGLRAYRQLRRLEKAQRFPSHLPVSQPSHPPVSQP